MVVSKFKSKISNTTYSIELYKNSNRTKNLISTFKPDYDTRLDIEHYVTRLKFSILTNNCYVLKHYNKIIGIFAYKPNTSYTEAVLLGYKSKDIVSFNVFIDYVMNTIKSKELVIGKHLDTITYNSLLRYGTETENKIVIRLQDYNKEVSKYREQLKEKIIWEQ